MVADAVRDGLYDHFVLLSIFQSTNYGYANILYSNNTGFLCGLLSITTCNNNCLKV